MNPTGTRPHILSNLAPSIERSVSVRYTQHNSDIPEEERVDLTCVDARLFAVLNDCSLKPGIIVRLSPNNPFEAPVLRDHNIPTVLRDVHTAEDRLIEVSFAIMHWTTVKSNHEIARDKDNNPYQCLTLKRVAIDYKLDDGKRSTTIGTDCNVDIFLPSGMIRLS